MQKTEKPPKRAESTSTGTGAVLEKSVEQSATIQAIPTNNPDEFKNQLLQTIKNYAAIADDVQNTKVSKPLNQQLTGLKFTFDKLNPEGDQLISVSQDILAHLARTHTELEKDPQVKQDRPAKLALETTQQTLLSLHEWLSQYQSDTAVNKQYQYQQKPPSSYTVNPSQQQYVVAGSTISSTGTTTSGATPQITPAIPVSGGLPSGSIPVDPNIVLQMLINELNVTTVAAFLSALQNLNQFLTANPNTQISLQLFYTLFNQLDATFQVLPEATATGTPQRQVIATMVAINGQVNQLYGFLTGLQIV